MKNGRIAEHVVVGMLLACAGGYVDAYTYLTRGGVFCYAQTANLLLLAVSIVRGGAVLRFAATGGAFIAGLLLARGLRHATEKYGAGRYRIAALLLMLAVLGAVGALGAETDDLPVVAAIAFVSAVQFSAFRLLDGHPYATTMCTGNLRMAADCLYEALFLRRPGAWRLSAEYLAVIAMFGAGAALSALGAATFAGRSVWFAGIPLLCVVALLGAEEIARMRAARTDTDREGKE